MGHCNCCDGRSFIRKNSHSMVAWTPKEVMCAGSSRERQLYLVKKLLGLKQVNTHELYAAT